MSHIIECFTFLKISGKRQMCDFLVKKLVSGHPGNF